MVAKVIDKIEKFDPYKVTFDINSKEEAIALLCSIRQSKENVEDIITAERFHTMLNGPINFSELVNEIYEIQCSWVDGLEDEIRSSIK